MLFFNLNIRFYINYYAFYIINNYDYSCCFYITSLACYFSCDDNDEIYDLVSYFCYSCFSLIKSFPRVSFY